MTGVSEFDGDVLPLFVPAAEVPADVLEQLADVWDGSFGGSRRFDYDDCVARLENMFHAASWWERSGGEPVEWTLKHYRKYLEYENALIESNNAAIERELKYYDDGRYNTDGLGFDVVVVSDGVLTSAGVVVAAAEAALYDYPVLDEDDWNEREYRWQREWFDMEWPHYAAEHEFLGPFDVDAVFSKWLELYTPVSGDFCLNDDILTLCVVAAHHA